MEHSFLECIEHMRLIKANICVSLRLNQKGRSIAWFLDKDVDVLRVGRAGGVKMFGWVTYTLGGCVVVWLTSVSVYNHSQIDTAIINLELSISKNITAQRIGVLFV